MQNYSCKVKLRWASAGQVFTSWDKHTSVILLNECCSRAHLFLTYPIQISCDPDTLVQFYGNRLEAICLLTSQNTIAPLLLNHVPNSSIKRLLNSTWKYFMVVRVAALITILLSSAFSYAHKSAQPSRHPSTNQYISVCFQILQSGSRINKSLENIAGDVLPTDYNTATFTSRYHVVLSIN